MPGRIASSEDYRYGFNGKEKDDEVKGSGNSLDFGARMYDARLGRWLSRDALEAKYVSLSPYQFVANSPMILVDPNGEKIVIYYRDETEQLQKVEYQVGMQASTGNLFADETIRGLNILAESNSGTKIANNVAKHEREVGIIYEPGAGQFDQFSYILEFDPTNGQLSPEKADNGNRMAAPILGLLHELDHANEFNRLLDIYEEIASKSKDISSDLSLKEIKKSIKKFGSSEVDSDEEMRVINGSEAKIAHEFRYGTRSHHYEGKSKAVENVDSIDELDRKELKQKRAELNGNRLSLEEKRQIKKSYYE